MFYGVTFLPAAGQTFHCTSWGSSLTLGTSPVLWSRLTPSIMWAEPRS